MENAAESQNAGDPFRAETGYAKHYSVPEIYWTGLISP